MLFTYLLCVTEGENSIGVMNQKARQVELILTTGQTVQLFLLCEVSFDLVN